MSDPLYPIKKTLGSVFPEGAVDAQEWSRTESLLTPEQLVSRFLFGVPLYAPVINPITKRRDEYTPEMIHDAILNAIANLEVEMGITIFPVQFEEKQPFDYNFWRQYGYTRVRHRPISSVDQFTFSAANEENLYEINLRWVEHANFHKGQINLIPLVPAAGVNFIPSSGGGSGGAAYLTFMNGFGWIPAFCKIKYTAGFPNGQIPRVINQLIGINASMDILADLAATYKASSYSLSLDGGSQSVSGPGPQIYNEKLKYLGTKKDGLIKKIKNMYGLQVISDYV